MHSTYPIGIPAEKIVAVTFRLDGTITPVFRRRQQNGRVVDASTRTFLRAQQAGPVEFVARVAPGHSGTVEMKYDVWEWEYGRGVIALGQARPFVDRELGPRHQITGGDSLDHSAVNPDEAWFRFSEGSLAWTSGVVSGEAIINKTYPELTVALRLPPGNQGEISFASPLFVTADGEPASVLSVA